MIGGKRQDGDREITVAVVTIARGTTVWIIVSHSKKLQGLTQPPRIYDSRMVVLQQPSSSPAASAG